MMQTKEMHINLNNVIIFRLMLQCLNIKTLNIFFLLTVCIMLFVSVHQWGESETLITVMAPWMDPLMKLYIFQISATSCKPYFGKSAKFGKSF